MGFISRPFGALLLWFINIVGNYGVALIFFTILVRIILLPLSIKQQKSMQETQRIQPEISKIREKYKNDKEKLNEETMKLYKEHNVNPAGGCFPLLIQFPIIIGLYQTIIRPLTYMFNLTADQIAILTEKVNEVLLAQGKGLIEGVGQFEIKIAQNLNADILESVGLTNINIINFNFLGINLGDTPNMSLINLLWVIPIFAALTTFLTTKVTTALSGNQQAEGSAASTMKTMNMLFPVMTAWFTFTMPAGVGFYWILGNVIQIVQQVLLNLYFKSKEAANPLVIESNTTKPNKGGGKKK